MMTAAKQLVKDLFGAAGLDIQYKRPPAPPSRTSMQGALRQLSSQSFRPRAVIEVGVAPHSVELYEEFRDASILLIEPLAELEPLLREVCKAYNAQYVLAAASQSPGRAVLNVHENQLDSSSLLKEAEGAAVDGVPREVPVVTIDQVCEERNLKGPYLIKVDVQGAELHVLEGATRTLRETEAIILEVSLLGMLIGGPQVFDIVSWMKKSGFAVYDILGLNYRPLDGALAQVDMVFVREDGLFRQNHAYATPEQRKALAWRMGKSQLESLKQQTCKRPEQLGRK